MLTGASSGIGLELARLLVGKYGCTVFGIARRAAVLEKIWEELGERFIPCPFDVTVRGEWEKFFSGLDRDGILPDILINNAGILPRFMSYSAGDGAEELRRVMELNFLAQTVSCELFLSRISDSEGRGIVNVASSAALAFLPGTAAYSASKAASLAFTQCLSVENRKKVYVASVCPGYTRTPLFDAQKGWTSADDGKKRSFIKKMAMAPDKMAKKILRSVERKRRKIVHGIDAHGMSVLYRIFGTPALDLFDTIMRSSGDEMFDGI